MPHRILLCDDEPHILLAAEIKFRRAGYEVRTAADGAEAWEMIRQWVPDILISDYQMPRMDGIELCRRCRENDATRDLPILMLTAKGFELTQEDIPPECRLAAVLHKPFSPRELLRCVEELLESRQCDEPHVCAREDVS